MNSIKKRVAFYTLGCKLNFTETSTIARSLDSESYERVEFEDSADIYVINTCTVTGAADKKCRQIIQKTIKKAPEAYIVVTGCYAQLKPKEINSIPGVDLVLGNNEKFDLALYIERIEDKTPVELHSCEPVAEEGFNPSFSLNDRTRSFLKVQDGCDYLCSYCTIPLARGKSRNQTITECLAQAKEIISSGIKEIVLTGVNIGDFGKSTGETFFGLLKELVKVDGLERIRISSIEPNLLTDEIINLVAQNRTIVPHFHIPLQSGCNKTLGTMKRRYQREVFEDRVLKIRETIPDAGIGADVIVGFPGEGDDDFNDTRLFLEETDLSYLHVFTYSARNNTPAAIMPDQVPVQTKALRSKQLQKLSEKKRIDFYRSCIGKSYKVLWESRSDDGDISGFTENYIRVISRDKTIPTGTISMVTLSELDNKATFICK